MSSIEPAEKLSRKDKKGQTRERLIDAALSVVIEGGYKNLTMRKVTKCAGIAQPSFYSHFDSMDDLLSAAFERLRNHYIYPMQDMMLKMIKEGTEETLPLVISRMYSMLFDYYLSHPELFCLTTIDSKSGGAVGQRYREEYNGLREVWSDFFCRNAGVIGAEVEKQHADMVVDGVFAMIDALLLGYIESRYTDKAAMVELCSSFTLQQLSLATDKQHVNDSLK
ncbi:hypothetical protein A9Q99_08910 [Gammaproteobacteria bacterium 45_16_T64]|nr:hypothetical protein A9Q99_08910 [Gammaproteobacteria bacterium 45_16_T64]